MFSRLSKGIKLLEDSIKANSGRAFSIDHNYGYITACPTNLGTGMRASVQIDLPGWAKEGNEKLVERCKQLKLQPRGTRGESGGMTGRTYDISNKHRLGFSEVQLVQTMIDGVTKLAQEDQELMKKHHRLKLAVENSHPLNSETCAGASEFGHLDVVNLAKQGNRRPWNSSICEQAAEEGQLNALKWAIKNGCPPGDERYTSVSSDRIHAAIVEGF